MSLTLDPLSEVDSIVQPGRPIPQLPEELPGTLTITSDSLTGPEARGSFADVFKGIWDCPGQTPQTVAIKRVRLPGKNIAPERYQTRIRRETFIWSALQHDNILPFIGYKVDGDVTMLVSPWCENGNLSAFIAKNPNLTRSDKLKLLADAARGLDYLHKSNPQIVHGDIKPENVIIKDDLVATLCDFGISKLHVSRDQHTGLTTSGITAGTSGYQAVEILSDKPATPETDVYAFGGVILAGMSGYQPFHKKTTHATIFCVMSGQMPTPADHPRLPKTDPLWALLKQCWSMDPEARPSMFEVSQKLEAEQMRT